MICHSPSNIIYDVNYKVYHSFKLSDNAALINACRRNMQWIKIKFRLMLYNSVVNPDLKPSVAGVTLCQCIFCWFLICIYSSIEPTFCNRYLLNVISLLSHDILALSSLRLPSFELADNQNFEIRLISLSGWKIILKLTD